MDDKLIRRVFGNWESFAELDVDDFGPHLSNGSYNCTLCTFSIPWPETREPASFIPWAKRQQRAHILSCHPDQIFSDEWSEFRSRLNAAAHPYFGIAACQWPDTNRNRG